MNKYLDNPIPVIADPGNCKRRAFIDSPLVDIEQNDKLLIEMQYPILGFENAEKRCMARKEVVEMLYRAAENGMHGDHLPYKRNFSFLIVVK